MAGTFVLGWDGMADEERMTLLVGGMSADMNVRSGVTALTLVKCSE